jgi:hypothetical protein
MVRRRKIVEVDIVVVDCQETRRVVGLQFDGVLAEFLTAGHEMVF